MIPLERGFLLLQSHLGAPQRKPLTTWQMRDLALRVPQSEKRMGEVEAHDLEGMGYSRTMAQHIVSLLNEERLLDQYLEKAERAHCVPITRVTETYPLILRKRLSLDSPGCLWAKGNLALLNTPAVSVVGSRDLREENRAFAEAVGKEAARQGYTLVSGNARGADRVAQDACLNAGGRVISVVADDLISKYGGENLLFLSQDDYDAPFTVQRALSRNRVIHCLGSMVFAAQAAADHGGTWGGTVKNLQNKWSPVAVFNDGSEAAFRLIQLGAVPITAPDFSFADDPNYQK